jgi:hypothetical protein
MLAAMRLAPFAFTLLVTPLLSACAPPRRADPVATDARSTNTGGGVVIVEGSVYVDGASSSGASGTCGATLRVYDVRVRAGCTIDERVTGAPGILSYPCGGGPATASFGASVFAGAVSPAGDVDLSIRTGFDFSDGCHWETKQYLRGNLNSGALAYEYREEPDDGQRGCAGACVATASVTVER